MTPGNPTDARSNSPAIFASSAMIASTFFGVALCGVLIFWRSPIISPFSSSAAALIPVPPTSTASVVIDFGAACVGRGAGFAVASGFAGVVCAVVVGLAAFGGLAGAGPFADAGGFEAVTVFGAATDF